MCITRRARARAQTAVCLFARTAGCPEGPLVGKARPRRPGRALLAFAPGEGGRNPSRWRDRLGQSGLRSRRLWEPPPAIGSRHQERLAALSPSQAPLIGEWAPCSPSPVLLHAPAWVRGASATSRPRRGTSLGPRTRCTKGRRPGGCPALFSLAARLHPRREALAALAHQALPPLLGCYFGRRGRAPVCYPAVWAAVSTVTGPLPEPFKSSY